MEKVIEKKTDKIIEEKIIIIYNINICFFKKIFIYLPNYVHIVLYYYVYILYNLYKLNYLFTFTYSTYMATLITPLE